MRTTLNPVESANIASFVHGVYLTPEAKDAWRDEYKDPLRSQMEYQTTAGDIVGLGDPTNGHVWVNARERASSPLVLDYQGRFLVSYQGHTWDAQVGPVPLFHSNGTTFEGTDGVHRPLSGLIATHGDRCRAPIVVGKPGKPGGGCTRDCKFCSLALKPSTMMPAEVLIAGLKVARTDPVAPVWHALISGGTPNNHNLDKWYEIVEAVVQGVKSFMTIDIMLPPDRYRGDSHQVALAKWHSRLKFLFKIGIDTVSLNIEHWTEAARAELIPMKAQAYTGPEFIDFLEVAVDVFGTRRVQSLVIAGPESVRDTRACLKAILKVKAMPVLSPLTLEGITTMPVGMAEPSFRYLKDTYLGAVELSEDAGIPFGPLCEECMHNTLRDPWVMGGRHAPRVRA
jgi:hypothetical protein